jgi:hypothetical protein
LVFHGYLLSHSRKALVFHISLLPLNLVQPPHSSFFLASFHSSSPHCSLHSVLSFHSHNHFPFLHFFQFFSIFLFFSFFFHIPLLIRSTSTQSCLPGETPFFSHPLVALTDSCPLVFCLLSCPLSCLSRLLATTPAAQILVLLLSSLSPFPFSCSCS